MDSCHIFNFLFGTRKATSELRKCFGVATGSSTKNKDKRHRPQAGAAGIHTKLQTAGVDRGEPDGAGRRSSGCTGRRVELRLAGDGSDSSALSSSVISEPGDRCSAQADRLSSASGLFEAQLVRLSRCDEADGDFQSQTGHSSEQRPSAAPADENNNTQQPFKVIIENPANKLDNSNQIAKEAVDSSHQRTINVYDNPLSSSQAGPPVNNATNANESELQPKVDDKTRRTRSERIRNLAQSFEVTDRTEQQATATRAASGDCSGSSNKAEACLTPRRLPRPPETPPKSARAKCLNHQLSLRKPMSIASLFQNETFLVRHFFDKLAPLDRCAAAQVCRKWRNILYANQAYWSELTGVIDCTQLRREQLAECIMNTLQSAKLRHSQHHHQQTTPNGHTARPQAPPGGGVAPAPLLNHHHHNTLQQQQQQQVVADSQRHLFDLGQLDEDEIWRIQELCNRYTMRAFGNGLTNGNTSVNQPANQPPNRSAGNLSAQQAQHQHDHSEANHTATSTMTTTTTNTTSTSGIANSKSSSSQISSSTLSSISISSLLSPLSESSRVDSIKERLYSTLEERGFVSICLFGATDDDIDELVSRTRPNGARRQLKLARLCNCALTDRGFETLAAAFGQIEELELIGCNEITNGLDLRPLRHLRRLLITDCINIADGLAPRIVEVLHQLETLVVQAYHLTDAFVEFIALGAGDTSRFKRLELPNCKEITNASALTIAKHFSQSIETLSISGSTKVNDDGVELLAEHMKSLVSLDLGWLKIGDLSLECIACDLRNLRELILDRNAHITDLGLSYLATMANLSLLYVRWCPQLTDKSIVSISNMRSLTSLSLAGLHQITARGILSLIDSQQLEELELTNCPAVTSELQQFLAAKLAHCNIIC